jgi:8-hydroxy-5-deazaflavin:NADPH oxidoreductase
MKIGIIGAGFIGRAVGALALQSGHEVMLSNSRGPQSLFSQRFAMKCEVGTVDEAAAFGDIVVVAIPLTPSIYRSVPVAPLAGKVVIDTGNHYPERDGQIAEFDRLEITLSEWFAQLLPASRIVKAFNAIKVVDLESDGRPAGSPDRRALPIAGNDPEGKAIVAKLHNDFGFDAVDAGLLSEGWRFDRAMPVYVAPLNKTNLEKGLAATKRKAPAAA